MCYHILVICCMAAKIFKRGMSMKKLLAFVLVFIMLLGAVACSSSKNEKPNNQSGDNESES